MARPTDSELAILNILWEHGPSNGALALAGLADTGHHHAEAQQIHGGRVWSRTIARTYVYSAMAERERDQRQLLKDRGS